MTRGATDGFSLNGLNKGNLSHSSVFNPFEPQPRRPAMLAFRQFLNRAEGRTVL